MRPSAWNASLLHENVKAVKKLNTFYKFTNLEMLKAGGYLSAPLLQLTII